MGELFFDFHLGEKAGMAENFGPGFIKKDLHRYVPDSKPGGQERFFLNMNE